jgi:2-polyprenyl-6-methoxyphenol hydroxylase-like FAD-dependent oxidoreductase
MPKLKILICGGGLAGNALAFWLTQQDHDITVLERFPSLRTTGLQIDIRGHGVSVLRLMGLDAAFRAHAVSEQGLGFVNSAGALKAYFPANRSGEGVQGFTTEYEIMRGDLCRLIHDPIQERVRYVFGKTVQSYSQKAGVVEVLYDDGERESFDLLVGADGLWSHTRRMMLGPGVTDPVTFLGAYGAYFTAPVPQQEGEEYNGTVYIAPGRRVLFTRRHRADQIQVYIFLVAASSLLQGVQKNDVHAEKRVFKEALRGVGWKAEEYVKWMQDADDFYCERLSTVDMPAWSEGNVVLLGDAAYCPSAMTGMGTTSAVVGAYVLAGEIGKACQNPSSGDEAKEGIPSALKAYEEKMRPFMQQVQAGITPDNGWWTKLPASWWGIAFLNFLLGVAAWLRLDAFAKLLSREEVVGWELPAYEGMDLRGSRGEWEWGC